MNSSTSARNKQDVRTSSPNKHDLSFVHILNEIPLTGKAPNVLTPMGPRQADLDELIEALDQDGIDGFNRAKRAILKREPRLQALLATVQPVEQEQQEELHPDFAIGKNGKKVFKTFSEDDIEEFPDIEYMVSGVLQTATVSLVFGESNTGKTFFALDLAEHIARGMEWLGRRVKQGKILYIYAESKIGLKPRVLAWKQHHNVASTPNLAFITRPVQLVNDRDMLLDTIAEQEEVPALIVIDTFSNCAIGTNQNDQAEVFKVLNTAHEIVREYGAHVLVVHHTNKSDTANGSQAFKNHVDTQIKLTRADKSAPIVVSCEKQRDAEMFADITIELQVVNLYINPKTLEQVSSCVVVNSTTPTAANEPPVVQQKMLEILTLQGRTSYNAWKKACEDAKVVKAISFYTHVQALLALAMVKKTAEGPGKRTWYEVAEGTSSSEPVEPGTN